MPLFRKIASALIMLILALSWFANALAVSPSDYDMQAPHALDAGHLYAESALLVDAGTGEVLFSKNSRVRMYPASTTKIMTLLLALESGIDPDSDVVIPAEAADIPDGSSVIPVRPGDVTTFRDLLYGFMLSSGNDGANAIAALVDGGIGAFVDHMNARAAELGCVGTHFVNVHGYHDSEHYTTAQDLALISRVAMQNPMFRAIVAAPSWDMTVSRDGKTGTATIVNRNSLLLSNSKYYYPDCTGIKTGHHRRAGWCFVGSAKRDGMDLICVVLNCEKEDQKWYDAARLFEFGFTCYEPVTAQELLEADSSGFDVVQIEDAADDDPQGGKLALNIEQIVGGDQTRPVVAGSASSREAAASQLALSADIEWTRALQAPVSEGEALGRITCVLPDDRTVSAVLTASRAVERAAVATPTPAATLAATPSATPEAAAVPAHAKGKGVIIALLAALVVLVAAAIIIAIVEHRHRARRRAHRRRRRAAGRK